MTLELSVPFQHAMITINACTIFKMTRKLTSKNNPAQNLDARRAMLPYVHIRDHSNGGAVGDVPTLLPVPLQASETPRYCAGASLKQKYFL